MTPRSTGVVTRLGSGATAELMPSSLSPQHRCPSRHGTARDYSRFFPCFLTSEQGRKAMPYPARMTRDRLVTVIGSHRSHIQCPVAAGRVAPLRRPRHETTGLSGSGTASQDESRTRGRRQAAASYGRDRSRPLWPPRSASIHQRRPWDRYLSRPTSSSRRTGAPRELLALLSRAGPAAGLVRPAA